METLNNELRLLNDNDEVLCRISAVTYYDKTNEFDEGETFYIHPMTGSECQTVDQCMSGWSEQDEEDDKNWEALVEQIEKDTDLKEKLFQISEIDYYV